MSAERKSEVNELLNVAREHRKRGDRNAALTAFQAAAGLDASNRSIGVAMAGELRALDRLDEAEALLANILAAEPGSIAALIEQGHLARRRGDHPGGLMAFMKAAEVDPRHLGIKVEVARSLRALNRTEEAAVVLAEVLNTDAGFLPALIEQGHGRRKQGDHAGALASFEAAAKVDPAHVGIQLELAAELRKLQREPDAETVLRRLVEANPRNLSALVGLGHLLMETGRLDEAETPLQKAVAAEPRDPRASAALARLARLRGDRPAIIRHMRSSADADPANTEMRLSLAAELRQHGDLAGAKAEVRAVLDARPDHGAAWLQLGLLRRADRDRPGAIEAFETARAKAPQAIEPVVELARERWAAGEPDASLELLGQALDIRSDHLGALILAAEQSLLAERPEAAMAFAERAIASEPRQLGPYLLAARAAAAIPDRLVAERFIDNARDRFGAIPDVLATQIHVLRCFHALAAVRSLAATTEEMTNPGLWAEGVSAAIALGDFATAERSLALPPAADPDAGKARARFLAGQLAAARRDYRAAIRCYTEAIERDPSDGGWHTELARACMLVLDIEGARAHLRDGLERNRAAAVARRQSLNPSQHHIGQLLDEFALDERVLGKLQAALLRPASEQIDAIKPIVRSSPDNTAAALMLLIAMRRSGRLRYAPGRFGRLVLSRIPKRIVQFWDAETPPADVRDLMASWDDPRAVFRHLVFSEASAKAYLAANASAEVGRAFERANHPAQRADLFRLAYLATDGGFYVDADDRRAAPFDALAPKGAMLVGYQEDYGTLANNFLAAVPGRRVIKRALDLAVAAINRGDNDTVWLSTGPGLMTRAFAQTVAEPGSGSWLERTMIRELHEMQALVEIHCPAAYKRTDRHWSRTARRRA